VVERPEDAHRRAPDDIPPIGNIKSVCHAYEWEKKFGYPLGKIRAADYYVEYSHTAFGSHWLIEASRSHLHSQLKQLCASAEFFASKKIQVDNYLVVLDELSRRDKQKYRTSEITLKPLKQIQEKLDNENTREYKIRNKAVFLIYRRDFERLKK